MTFSFQLLNVDFIDSLFTTKSDNSFILNIVCYFFKKVMSFAISTINVQNAIQCLKKMFIMFRRSLVIYCDQEQHFDNSNMRLFLKKEDVFITYSSLKTSKSIEMMKISNKLLKNVLRKQTNE